MDSVAMSPFHPTSTASGDLTIKYRELEVLSRECSDNLIELSSRLLKIIIKYKDTKSTDIIHEFYQKILSANQAFKTLLDDLYDCKAHNKKSICYPATKLALSSMCFNILECIRAANTLFNCFRERHLDVLISNMSILDATEQIIDNAKNSDPNLLFYLPPEHDEWKLLNSVLTKDTMNNNGEYYQKAMHENMVLYGVANRGFKKTSGSIMNLFRVAAYFIYFHFKNDRAEIIADKFLNTMQSDSEYSIKLINLNRDPLFSSVLAPKMEDIKEHHVILVPKMLRETTLPIINSILQGSFNATTFMKPTSFNSNYSIPKNEDEYDSSKYVQIRILCSKKIPIRIKTRQHRKLKPFNIFNTIIIEIHGGGFVGSSSKTHQHYLRKWANVLGFPIFALDYRLAPEYPYPCAHDDIIQAYYWIIKYSEIYLSIKPEKIILVGDSAGGNLALALYLLAFNYRLPLPAGILLGYPALDLSNDIFTPSIIMSFNDFALRFSILKLIYDKYVPTSVNPGIDRFISPIKLTDSEIDAIPPIRIMSAGMDPLHDQTYLFALKLAKRNAPIKVIEYCNLPHAFWSVEYPGTIETLNKAISLIKEILVISKNKSGERVDESNVLDATYEKVYS